MRGRGRGKRETPAAPPSIAGLSISSGSSGEEQKTVRTLTEREPPVRSQPGCNRGFRTDVPCTITRPTTLQTKIGEGGSPLALITNYFIVEKAKAWKLNKFSIKISPEDDRVGLRKSIVRQNADKIGAYIFDGSTLRTTTDLKCPITFEGVDEKDPDLKKYKITITEAGELKPGDSDYVQFFNNLLKGGMYDMKLTSINRKFFDPEAAIKMPAERLTIWPGFTTSIRQHENNLLLCVELVNKVLRMDSVYFLMEEMKRKNPRGYEEAVKNDIVGSIVMTPYNKKTYKITEVLKDLTPLSTFDMKGKQTTYVEYYKTRYGIDIKHPNQPLLLTEPSKADHHRGQASSGPVHLVPEHCNMTGLTDAMRANFNLMKEVNKYLHVSPQARVDTIMKFAKRLQSTPEVKEKLESWGFRFSNDLASVRGRVLDREKIIFATPRGNEKPEQANDKADWTNAFRSRQMLSVKSLDSWAIIVPQRDRQNLDNLIQTMIKVAKPLNFIIQRPTNIFELQAPRPDAYTKAIDDLIQKNSDLQMLFVILPTNKIDNYAAVKKRLSVNIGIPSQCFLSKNVTNKGLMSVATKVVIQMNAKLGGEPWSCPVPVKKMMVVGFDVHHGVKGSGSQAVGAMVSTTTGTFASYFSTVSFHSSGDELARLMAADLIKCVEAYKQCMTELPERIMFYRDAVGDGQLQFVIDTELEQIKKGLETFYAKEGLPMPKLSFIIVTKKSSSRIFTVNPKIDNPPPGTICDDIITLPERYDFFLVPQVARQGAVSPVNYNVIFDTQGLKAERMQAFTYKLCHLYFNWSGTVSVPAPCQYAHKLAFLTGTAIGSSCNSKLSYNLHFL